MRHFQRRRLSVYWVLLASFLLMLILSTIAQAIAALQSNQILTREIERANDASLETLRASFDDTFKVLQEWCMELSLDTQLNSLIAQQGVRRSPQSAYLNVPVVKRLSEVRFASSYVGGLYIYLLKGDYVLTPEGKYSAEEYFQKHFGDGQTLTLDAWRQMHEQPFFRKYETITAQADSALNRAFLFYSLPVGAASSHSAVLGVELSMENLNRQVTQNEWLSGAYVGIIDSSGNVISLGSGEGEMLRCAQLGPDGMRMKLQRIQGQEFYVTDIASEVNGWRYISLIPRSVYQRPRDTLLLFFAAVLGVTLAVGVALSFLLARFHYTPVQRLVRLMDAEPEAPEPRGAKNEYAALEMSIQSVQRENWALSELNRDQEEALRRRFLTSLLQGSLVDAYEIEGVLRECGMRLKGDGYAVVVFGLRAGRSPARPCGTLEGAIRTHLLPRLDAAYVLLESEACVIVSGERDGRERLRACLEAALAACGGEAAEACVSAVHEDAGGIHEAYLECSELLEYAHLMGLGGVCFYGDMPQRSEDRMVNTMVSEEKLINLLRAGQYPQAQKVFGEMLDETFRVGGMSIQAMKCNLYGLIYSLSRIVGTPRSPEQLPVLETLRPVERLMVCKTVPDLRREMNALLREMDEAMRASVPPRVEGAELVDGASAFIQARYAQQDLSVAMVAEAMGVTPVAITRVFQRLLGMGTLDYIHHTRLKAAKQLLSASERSIREIAELTGYNNSVTFIRVFKKYEGVTPGQYRENEQQA